ncbi:MAG TPA: HAD family hydrolase [Actinomycetota bacterium]|nr:HAD family hydrolase [Actinomycetota bacterium]
MRFRAVFFDAGETLVHPSPSFPELFSRVLADAGHDRDPVAVTDASAAVFAGFARAADDRELWTISPERSARFWKGVYGRMLEALSLPSGDGLRDVLYATFTDPANYALFDDVRPTLDALGDGPTLGIVSNYEAWLEDLLGLLGVRDRFPVRAISGIEGAEKPDPALFRVALDRAGVAPRDAAYVGDNPPFDVAPARDLGMTPVLIDRRRRFPGEDCIRIDDLRELPAALEGAA